MPKKTTNAEIVSIGSELLLGQIVDTNSTWMAERLTEIGVNLFYKTIVGDNPNRMAEACGSSEPEIRSRLHGQPLALWPSPPPRVHRGGIQVEIS